MEAAQRVRDQGADVVVTSIIDGAVGVAAALNVAAALGVDRACGLATSTLLAKDLGDPPPIREGSMALSRPGVGVVLDADRLAAVTVGETSESS
jgi:L-alanine-DL-glutamate epimerase-like enolase superfamily enzyme